MTQRKKKTAAKSAKHAKPAKSAKHAESARTAKPADAAESDRTADAAESDRTAKPADAAESANSAEQTAAEQEETDEASLWPDWLAEQIAACRRSQLATAFVVHGNINDLVANPDVGEEEDTPYISATELWHKFVDNQRMVMFYDIATGLTFLRPEMEQEFRDAAGLNAPAADANDPIAAARAQMQANQEIPKEPNACLALVDRVMRRLGRCFLMVQDAHLVVPAAGNGGLLPANERVLIEMFKNWGRDPDLRDNGSVVILQTPESGDIASELRREDSEIRLVRIPKPDDAVRLAYIQALTSEPAEVREARTEMNELAAQLKRPGLRKKTKERFKAQIQEIYDSIQDLRAPFSLPEHLDAASLARACQGMSLRQVREIFLQAEQAVEPINLAYAKAKKREILNREYGDVMEVVEAKRGLEDIGGHEHIKAYFRDVLKAIRDGENRLVPLGTLLMGPPGTGKTAIVEALAYEAGYNFVKTKNIRSMWVGDSEARMERLVAGLKALAPVVVMNDEADLNDAQRDAYKGDSGVSERLMKAWMELLSDPRIRGKIIVISCTNRPDRLDAAMKRSGRNDERILMPMPAEEERKAIFRVMFNRHDIPTAIKDFSGFAAETPSLSGADIEQAVLRSFGFAERRRRKKVSQADLKSAIADLIPSANQKEIDTMTLCGLAECSSRRLLPPHLPDIIAGIRERRLADNFEALLASLETRGVIEPPPSDV